MCTHKNVGLGCFDVNNVTDKCAKNVTIQNNCLFVDYLRLQLQTNKFTNKW